MGSHSLGTTGIAGAPAAARAAEPQAPRIIDHWDRFGRFDPLTARFALFAVAALLVLSALVPINAGESTVRTQTFVENVTGEEIGVKQRDRDLALYDRATARIAAGENYYDFIAEEQRRSNFPIRPGLAVRIPTLAYINAALGETGQAIAAVLLMLAVLMAWWQRLGEEPGARRYRMMAMALLFVGASLGLNRYFFALHELWAGMLLALAFGLHRPQPREGGKWGASLAVAALAVAIREHALPFILLMGAMAAWRRNWKEALAWGILTLAFVALLTVHLSIIAGQTLPTDQYGQGWLYLRGLSGWISNIALSSNLRFLPHWLAGPAVILMVLGWAAWRSPAGQFGTLLFLGYGLLFMIAGRGDNYYWGAMVAPAMFIGLAFAPMGLKSQIRAARAK